MKLTSSHHHHLAYEGTYQSWPKIEAPARDQGLDFILTLLNRRQTCNRVPPLASNLSYNTQPVAIRNGATRPTIVTLQSLAGRCSRDLPSYPEALWQQPPRVYPSRRAEG